MNVSYHELSISTKVENDMVDITNDIQKHISTSTLKDGIACVFVPGSTGTITTVEYEPGLQKDVPRALEHIAPKNIPYDHHETWHDDNGRSHVKATLMGPGITIPFKDKKLIHGTWQQIIFMELDTRPRKRTIIIQLIGE